MAEPAASQPLEPPRVYLVHMVVFTMLVGVLVAVILPGLYAAFVANPVLYSAGILSEWRPGDGTIVTMYKNTIDFYFSFGIGLSLTPGPNSLLVLTHGALHGLRKTVFTAFGGCLGLPPPQVEVVQEIQQSFVDLSGQDGKSYDCSMPMAKWRSIADGLKKPIKVGVITGSADCDTL